MDDKDNRRGTTQDYPYVCTTYSVTEQWQTGAQTRSIPWLNELISCNFIELSEELAKEKGIKNGDTVRVWNNRGSVKVRAMVTIRMQPMQINGKLTHVVGMPHHFSWAGSFATGDNVNDLTPNGVMAFPPPMRFAIIRAIICPMTTNIRIGKIHVIRKLTRGDSLCGICLV